ncbi:hypothetical protein F9K98_13370 [Brucella anthropi]|uniref:Uncharacterized protein n=1 Tax=Brucella anthropi (strain ATCC 49188 / DSM 6882 / CCUG 24695 / JCM 21032 / LMG 3331 / NBRC 15819 / NCTC 12168 / Alc 37) TaxID=439375 RepID=A6WVG3_BRUA4|nr:hypothetical protein [Brucella anthropi]ABS12967.1 hypothetical protein Oant_0236 [Brucella anthropi ATCC 49188]KAB2762776.1 hypothetical protein F9K98_13370 [Brucella anthropi]NKC47581.1 hypothetical protein [Brucella anthropi ATCC 49188]NKC48964.1 hypothetical protein [Brucella anthropi ATCC 49188]QQC24779.1 hypothetical protein I6H96_11370 [Brucella anthropi]
MSGIEFTATIQADPDSWASFMEWIEEAQRKQLDRIKKTSLLSGMEVTVSMEEFGYAWSPVYWHEYDEPIAWVHNETGARVNGSKMPDQ